METKTTANKINHHGLEAGDKLIIDISRNPSALSKTVRFWASCCPVVTLFLLALSFWNGNIWLITFMFVVYACNAGVSHSYWERDSYVYMDGIYTVDNINGMTISIK